MLLAVMELQGAASASATERFRQRFPHADPTHFRRLDDRWVSSIGLGTYLGDPDDATDARTEEAIAAAIALGCNLLDTAINYRCQRSERVIGRTVARLAQQHTIERDELILCTKGGYVPFDGAFPDDPHRYVIETFISPALIAPDDLVGGCHCLAPRYLEQQLQASLRNLDIETIDVYYLHNPEQQLDEIPRETLLTRMEAAFRMLERQVEAGRVRRYGIATWNGLRAHPSNRNYLSLPELVALAQRAAGQAHHFRVIQLPYNLAMPEAATFRNQVIEDHPMSVLEAADRLGLSVIASASLLQSRLARLPGALHEMIPGAETDAQRAIHVARSTPGITAALVGMQQRAHVEENLRLVNVPMMTPEQVAGLFVTHRR